MGPVKEEKLYPWIFTRVTTVLGEVHVSDDNMTATHHDEFEYASRGISNTISRRQFAGSSGERRLLLGWHALCRVQSYAKHQVDGDGFHASLPQHIGGASLFPPSGSQPRARIESLR